jgi:hypothetical protein
MTSNLDVLQASSRARDGKVKNLVTASEAENNKNAYNINTSAAESLLQGDHDEEQRMADRVKQINENSTNGAQRLDNTAIAATAAATAKPLPVVAEANAEGTASPNAPGTPNAIARTRTASQRRKSVANALGADPGPDEPDVKKNDPALKKELLAQQRAQEEKAKRDQDTARAKAEGENVITANIVMPQYKHDDEMAIDREVDPPSDKIFLGMGWDENKDTNRKHYRRFYVGNLEDTKEVLPVPSPFNQYDLKRGQTRGAKKGLWASITGNFKTDASG